MTPQTDPSVMTPKEQAAHVDYATRFGHSVANRFDRLRDDLVAASLHGAAIAFASPNFPGDPEGRRKFVGQAAWNMIRRELTFFLKKQPTAFTDFNPETRDDTDIFRLFENSVQASHPQEAAAEVDWRDEFEAIAASLEGKTSEVFRLAYGGVSHTAAEIGAKVGVKAPAVQYHLKKIRGVARRREQRESRLV